MNGDITAINAYARSTSQRARAIAQNTGCSYEDAIAQLGKDAKQARSKRVVAAFKKGAQR
jgi:chaperonin GroEL (HSP60 family)